MKAYPQYKDSGVPWLGHVPKHWIFLKLRVILTSRTQRNRSDLPLLSVVREKGVIKRNVKNKEENHNTIPEDLSNYKIVESGQFVMNKMKAWQGSYSVSSYHGIVSPAYFVFDINHVYGCFFNYAIRSKAYIPFFTQASDGVRIGQWDLNKTRMKEIPFVVPPQDEQIPISRYLDWQTSKINKFIKAKKKLLELLCERRSVITDNAIRLPETQHIRLGIVARQMERSVDRRNDEVYTPIGLYNRGRGIFHKQPTEGSELGESTFFEVKENDLVFSGQFAWEGAVAIASIDDDGCIASHRYPIFRGKEGIVDSAYLLAFFRTDLGDIILNHHSRGAAGRNRPLNPRTLMKEKIPIPPLLVQKDIADIVRQEIALRQEIAKEEKLIREYRDRLISDVVTGKVDVRSVKIPDFDSVEMEQEVEGDEEAEDELITESIEE